MRNHEAITERYESSLNHDVLARQNLRYRGTGGVSQGNRSAGFAPAFEDDQTGAVYLSRFADGSPAPIHILEGLPEEVVTKRDQRGRVTATVPSLQAGFVRAGRFYTRAEAAAYPRAN